MAAGDADTLELTAAEFIAGERLLYREKDYIFRKRVNLPLRRSGGPLAGNGPQAFFDNWRTASRVRRNRGPGKNQLHRFGAKSAAAAGTVWM